MELDALDGAIGEILGSSDSWTHRGVDHPAPAARSGYFDRTGSRVAAHLDTELAVVYVACDGESLKNVLANSPADPIDTFGVGGSHCLSAEPCVPCGPIDPCSPRSPRLPFTEEAAKKGGVLSPRDQACSQIPSVWHEPRASSLRWRPVLRFLLSGQSLLILAFRRDQPALLLQPD